MELNKYIRIYKNKRKQALLNSISPTYSSKYAFIGVGLHSLSTFYPILTYINTPIKYILTEKSDFGRQMASKFPFAKSTHNYEEILSDQEVKGIFISGPPARHFSLTHKALLNKKNVFVEKPVCFSLEELGQLISICKSNCIVGLQKRYSRINFLLRNNFTKPVYYSARYAVGHYPEGNALYELFIHPIDNLAFLFGKAKITYIKKIKSSNGRIIILNLEHDSGVNGSLELSTEQSWNNPIDTLRVEMPYETVLINYPGYMESTKKEKSFLGIPLQKVLQRPVHKNVIYNNKGIIHNIEKNILYEAGYFDEIKEFISLVEGNITNNKAAGSIHQLVNTYELMEYVHTH